MRCVSRCCNKYLSLYTDLICSVDRKTLDKCRGQDSLFPHFLTIRPHVTAA